MADVTKYQSATLETIGWTAVDVTPSDSTDLSKLMAFIVAKVGGDIKVKTSGGSIVTLYANPGIPLPFFVDRVYATGTTATGIVAGYNR